MKAKLLTIKRVIKRLLPLKIAVLLAIAISQIDRDALLNSIRQIPIWTVLLLVGFQFVTQLLVNFQWYDIAKRFGTSITFGEMFEVNCRGNVIDSVTPGVKIGGEFARVTYLKKSTDDSGTQVASIVLVQKLFSVSGLCLLVLVSVGYVLDHLSALVYLLPLVLLALIVLIFAMPSRINAYLQKKEPPKRKWQVTLREFLVTVTKHLGGLSKSAMLLLSFLSLFIWVLYPVKLYILVAQFVPDVEILYLVAIAFASYIVAMLPIFPGGLGGFEGTMTGLFVAIGLLVSDAVVITVLFRFLTFWFVLLLSLVFIGCLAIWKRRTIKK